MRPANRAHAAGDVTLRAWASGGHVSARLFEGQSERASGDIGAFLNAKVGAAKAEALNGMSDGVWRGVFLASAIFNFIVGVSVAFDTTAIAAAMGMEVARYDALWSPIVGWFVILFGLLYAVVWRDLDNRPIAFIGTLGKLGVVALMTLAWSRGLAPFAMVGLTLIDLAFAILFVMFLLTRRSAI